MHFEKEVYLSKNLRELINKRHYTISQVARSTGMPKSSLHKYMFSNSIPKGLIAFIRLSQFFDISIDELLFQCDQEAKSLPSNSLPMAEGRYEVFIKKILP